MILSVDTEKYYDLTFRLSDIGTKQNGTPLNGLVKQISICIDDWIKPVLKKRLLDDIRLKKNVLKISFI